MLIGIIILTMYVLSGLYAAYSGSAAQAGSAVLEGAGAAVSFCLSIGGAVCLWSAVAELLERSGAAAWLSRLLRPLLSALGIPEETVLLMLLRPVSGSAALSAAADVISRCGADSLAGRTAAVMCSSSDTTFYVIAVYFTAAGVKDSRWAVPAALCADAAGFLSAAWICRILWG